jgi:hypothetical protein
MRRAAAGRSAFSNAPSGRLLAVSCLLLAAFGCLAPSAGRGATRPTAGPIAAWFELDGQPAYGSVRLTARSHLRVAFSDAIRPGTIALMIDGEVLPGATLAWAADRTSAEVSLDVFTPYHSARLALVPRPGMRGPVAVQFTRAATVSTNPVSGVAAGFQPRTPLEIVVENSDPARPQAGLQGADLVFEYLSEYAITRMTAIYFNRIPDLVGPVRSCRMINPYLGYAYAGVAMCTGVSNGTARWMFGTTSDARPVPNLMEPFDGSGHFFRLFTRVAPHNAYTSGDRAQRLRSEAPQPAGDYAVDPPHDDAGVGVPADAPAVPLHSVTYTYDNAARQYLRADHGVPFMDQSTGQALRVKTVVLLHVPFHDAGWVEDDNGGAHSVWYDMLGSGPAEVYAEGRLVHATWHMGSAGQSYFDNHTPLWLADEAGRELLLDSGLTWVHVLGNGQDRCPQTPAACTTP